MTSTLARLQAGSSERELLTSLSGTAPGSYRRSGCTATSLPRCLRAEPCLEVYTWFEYAYIRYAKILQIGTHLEWLPPPPSRDSSPLAPRPTRSAGRGPSWTVSQLWVDCLYARGSCRHHHPHLGVVVQTTVVGKVAVARGTLRGRPRAQRFPRLTGRSISSSRRVPMRT